MGPLIMPLASYDANTDTYDVTCTENSYCPHFDYLELRNSMGPFMMPMAHMMKKVILHLIVAQFMMALASCDANTDTSSITLPKSHIPCHINWLDLRNINSIIDDYSADTNGVT